MAVLSAVFAALAVILSDVMCAVAAFNFCDMLWGIRYAGYSAPASVAFMTAVPYAVGIIICVILSLFLKKRA